MIFHQESTNSEHEYLDDYLAGLSHLNYLLSLKNELLYQHDLEEMIYYAVIWSTAVRYLIDLARESRYLAKRKSDIGQVADQTTVYYFQPEC